MTDNLNGAWENIFGIDMETKLVQITGTFRSLFWLSFEGRIELKLCDQTELGFYLVISTSELGFPVLLWRVLSIDLGLNLVSVLASVLQQSDRPWILEKHCPVCIPVSALSGYDHGEDVRLLCIP